MSEPLTDAELDAHCNAVVPSVLTARRIVAELRSLRLEVAALKKQARDDGFQAQRDAQAAAMEAREDAYWQERERES